MMVRFLAAPSAKAFFKSAEIISIHVDLAQGNAMQLETFLALRALFGRSLRRPVTLSTLSSGGPKLTAMDR